MAQSELPTQSNTFIYLDTCCFFPGGKEKALSMLPDDPHFNSIMQLAKCGTLTLLTSELQQLELKANINRVHLEKAAYKIFPPDKIASYIAQATTHYEAFVTRYNNLATAIELRQSHKEIIAIVQRAYELAPPFAACKGNEYKDALTANAIERFITHTGTHNKRYIIVTSDKMFAARLQENPYINIIENLKALLNTLTFLINKPVIIRKLERYVTDHIASIQQILMQQDWSTYHITEQCHAMALENITIIAMEQDPASFVFSFGQIIDFTENDTATLQINFAGACHGKVEALDIDQGIFSCLGYRYDYNDIAPAIGDFTGTLKGEIEIAVTLCDAHSIKIDLHSIKILSITQYIQPARIDFHNVGWSGEDIAYQL